MRVALNGCCLSDDTLMSMWIHVDVDVDVDVDECRLSDDTLWCCECALV